MILFVAGKLPANTIELLNRYFGDLNNKELALPDIQPTPATEKKYRVTMTITADTAAPDPSRLLCGSLRKNG
ncbi:MAG: hypothetical protein EOP51_24900 [Sphingobacteriales bacterium]|nr:MAG: hypothetical protein EOP51_24900 [Sphingobacteriales bacterium]